MDVREFVSSDYPKLSEIHNANHPDYTRSSEEYRTMDESLDRSKYYRQRYAFSENNHTIGFGIVTHVVDMYHPKKFWIELLVDPPVQGRGVASAIYERLDKELANLKAITAWSGSRENLPRLTAFYQKRGFQEKQRAWESRLNVPEADPTRFHGYIERVQKQGITFTNLTDVREKSSGSLHGLHELVQLISSDMPQPAQFTPISFEQWKSFELKSPNLLPEGYIIAKDGPKYIGLSAVWRIEQEPKNVVQGNTGVRREYRGRGIAVAMKTKVVEYAKRSGLEKIKTWNDSSNAAMLAVNTKLGFKREVGWLTLEKDLAK